MQDGFDFNGMLEMHRVAVRELEEKVAQAGEEVQWFKRGVSADSFCNIVFQAGSTMYAVLPVESEGLESVPGGTQVRQGARFLPHPFVLEQVLYQCEDNGLVPCFFPVVKGGDGAFRPATEGWNLWGVEQGKAVDPVRDAGTGLVRVSDWELHRKALCVVMSHIEGKLGGEVGFYYDTKPVAPQIFYKDAQGGECCVSVRAYFKGRAPLEIVPPPPALEDRMQGCTRYEASVGFCAKNGRDGRPYRGEKLLIQFSGLKPYVPEA